MNRTSSFYYIQTKKTTYDNNDDSNNSNDSKIISITDNKNNNCLEMGYILQKKIYIQKFMNNYSSNKDLYNIKKIKEIITDECSHIVPKLKDFFNK